MLFLICQYLSDFVDRVCASWRLPPLAAAFNSDTASFLEKIKRNGGFDFSKAAALKRACENTSAVRRLFFFCRRAAKCFIIKERADNSSSKSACYRLCVCASGSLITEILNCVTLIKISCLHLGQNSGKFRSSVSDRILIRVLLPQTGHNNHLNCSLSL